MKSNWFQTFNAGEVGAFLNGRIDPFPASLKLNFDPDIEQKMLDVIKLEFVEGLVLTDVLSSLRRWSASIGVSLQMEL